MASRRRRHAPRHGRVRWRWPLIGAGGGVIAVAAVALAVGIGQAAGTQACPAAQVADVQAAAAVAQEATHYVLQGLPNCSYTPPADGLYVALPAPEYANAAQCGGYLEVSGPDGSVRVQVIDQCPECAAGHIDLSETAFARLAPLSAGLITVSYTSLANPALPGPLSVEVKQGSSQYWLALLVDNTGNPLTSVRVETSSGWLSLARASYNYWIAPSGAGLGPFTVRLADTQGHQVTVAGITLSPGAVQSTGTWMYGGGGAPVPSAAATSAAAAPSPTRPSPATHPSPTPTAGHGSQTAGSPTAVLASTVPVSATPASTAPASAKRSGC
jgi:expansin